MNKLKVLVVDDEKMVVNYISKILEKSGFETELAYNGKEAIAKFLGDDKINIIITDILMPEMNGIELTEKIRSTRRNIRPYIIVLTSKNDEDTVKEALEKGADDFLFKPTTPVILNAYMKKAVRYLNSIDPNLLVVIPITLIDSKDKYTTFHSRNVKLYSNILGRLYLNELNPVNEIDGMLIEPNDFLTYLEIAALLHDVGKIGVPDYLILKPVRYTPDEYALMKTHTIEGAKLFSNLIHQYPNNLLLKMCLEATRWHHERWDGKGYPDGLKGDRIPLVARIVAIADVFDALTTRRAYRNEYKPEEAIDIMVKEEEGHFDPKLLEIFVEHKQLFYSLAKSRLAVQLEELRNQ